MYHASPKSITSGVPQGSVLGPLLFLIYVNYLPNHVQSPAGIKIFADDTKLYLGYTENQNTPIMQSLNLLFMAQDMATDCCLFQVLRHFLWFSWLWAYFTLLTFWYSFAIRINYKRSWGVFEFRSYAKYALLKYCRHGFQ